jgi:hypothetical protein
MQLQDIDSYAAIAPPTAEAELWEVATEDDPQVQAFLNPVVPIRLTGTAFLNDWRRLILPCTS